MMRLYSGCGTRRLTSTTMVLLILVDTTSPTFSFLNPCCWACASAILFLRSRKFPLSQHRKGARPVLAQRAQLLQSFELPHAFLELEPEILLFHLRQLVLQLFLVEILRLKTL